MYVIASVFGSVGAIIALFVAALLILRLKGRLIFGIYPRKTLFYHLKYGIALLVLKQIRKKIYKNQENKLNLEQFDQPQPLCDNPKSYDVVSFMAANAEGVKLMVTLERRKRGVQKCCIYVWLPGSGMLCSPNLPDMVHFTTDGETENLEFKCDGCHIYPEEGMRRWRLRYDGELRRVSENRCVTVSLDVVFSTQLTHFDYNKDLSAGVIADSIARESWNSAFYSMLKNVDHILDRRTHYEQNGELTGELHVENELTHLQLHGFRDHSFGTERCLSTINRYVYFTLFLDDGTSMVVGNLSQPSFFLSSLKVGYVCTRAGVYEPITKSNFELYSYGEKGTPPQNQNFIVHTATDKYFVQIRVEHEAVRYIGGNWESKVYNQFVSCTVNGGKGHGITEYLYRNASGRPQSVSESDPTWYKRVRQVERSLSQGQYVDDSFDF